MDPTLKQILTELVAVSQRLDAAQEQIRELQAAYTDLMQQLEERDALADSLR